MSLGKQAIWKVENSIANILVGCRNHERKSQKDLYLLFRNFVFTTCYRYDDQLSGVEELVTETFVQIFKKLGGQGSQHFAGKNVYDKVQIWIRQAAIRTCIENYKRKNKTVDILFSHDLINNQYELPVHCARPISHKQLIETIRELPPDGRIIYNLFAIEGMSHHNIAGHLNISVRDSRSTLERTRDKLRYLLCGENLSDQNATSTSYYPLRG